MCVCAFFQVELTGSKTNYVQSRISSSQSQSPFSFFSTPGERVKCK